MVPLVFFFIRFWGSIRAILYFAEKNHDNHYNGADGWLKYMQAFFDPSQGFFNAILFVLTSEEGRRNVLNAFLRGCRYLNALAIARFPFLDKSKKKRAESSNANSAEMMTGTSDGLFNSRKNNADGLRDLLVPSSTLVSDYQSEVTGGYSDDSEVYRSSGGVDEEGRVNQLDLLTVPDNMTVETLVRNSIQTSSDSGM